MESGSNCPVCKVPYQRREIRPAPHMDNLVNIYKSMEVASGVPIHVTQKKPTANLAGAEMQANDDLNDMREIGENRDVVKCQRMKGVSSIESKLEAKRSGRNRGKSSFSTNKRVQLPHSPITETPVREAKDGLGENKVIDHPSNKCSAAPSEHQHSIEKESPRLSPFFWLGENERSSQQTDVDQLTLSGTPEKGLSFSDLKDSDDDVFPEISSEEQPPNKCNVELFDSEMFEWTQRECSPELCPSPFKKVEEKDGDATLGKKTKAVSRDAAADSRMVIEKLTNVSPQEKNNIMDNELHNNAFSRRKGKDNRNGCGIPCKRGRKERKESKSKRQKKNVEVRGDYNNPKTPDDLKQCKGSDTEMVLRTSKSAGTFKTGHVRSIDARCANEVDDLVVPELPAPSRSKRGTFTDKRLKKIKMNCNSKEHGDEDHSLGRMKQKKNLAQPFVMTEKTNSSDELFLEKPCRVGKKSSSCNVSYKPQEICQLKSMFEQKISLDENLRGKIADGGESAAQATVDRVQKESYNERSGHSLNKGKGHCHKDMPFLRKCDTVSIKCAFCHSTEETEATGEMIHYSEGRPVAANHSGSSVIHSHKNCTEWAPNVYFEDDIAINLEDELTRSRRIKCSLCGVKGAALGCYEKSCRKSFHVPCAKLLRECRWDTDHFVILCPLHAASKFPSELPILEVRKGKCNPEGKLRCQRSQVAVRHATTTNKWNCGRSSEKVVLCCSALAAIEKEAVSELAKSSGAVVLRSWNPSVTHVIASTNENGACKRTLKVLMGILEGKWILSIKWVQACKDAMRLVEETPYEITCDVHGVQNGPRLGRLRLLNEKPKLFAGFKFYCTGEFELSYKGYLQDLVTVGGGIVLHRKPIAENHGIGVSSPSAPSTVIVYSIELPANCDLHKKDMILERRRSEAEALAISSGAKLATNSWVLNCIAGHKLQDP